MDPRTSRLSTPLFTFCWPIRSYSSEFQDCRKYLIPKGLCYGYFLAIYFSEHLKTIQSRYSFLCHFRTLYFQLTRQKFLALHSCLQKQSSSQKCGYSRRLVCRNAFQCDPLSLCKTILSFLFCFAFSTYTMCSFMSRFPICIADGRYSGMTRSCPCSSPRIIISLQTLRSQRSELGEDVLFVVTL